MIAVGVYLLAVLQPVNDVVTLRWVRPSLPLHLVSRSRRFFKSKPRRSVFEMTMVIFLSPQKTFTPEAFSGNIKYTRIIV